MPMMKVVQVPFAGGDFEVVDWPIPAPCAGEVLIKVQACGVCRGDVVAKQGTFPGLTYPRVPGHEVVGTIAALGEAAAPWTIGQRVGVGWHGGHCQRCDPCRHGEFGACETALTTGLSTDGGYAEYMIGRTEALLRVPQDLVAAKAAPLLCAGNTTFGALRSCGAQAGELVAIHGLGGLGHLGLQYAHRMGFRTAVLSHSQDKATLARQLGADAFIDISTGDPAAELQKLGGEGDHRHGAGRQGHRQPGRRSRPPRTADHDRLHRRGAKHPGLGPAVRRAFDHRRGRGRQR
jgi:D-arabinose 1-dehydrogenase-like Zn-dependent alcohol dehydrogenase